MFDHVVLRRADGGQPVSAGQIAEALLFYQKVHLVIDRGTLLGLVKQIGMPQLLLTMKKVQSTQAVAHSVSYPAGKMPSPQREMSHGNQQSPASSRPFDA